MSRQINFDKEKVIELSMAVFWNKGINHTSVEDLLLATGLSRSSLYNSFGGKSNLFRMSLQRYVYFLIDTLNATYFSVSSFRQGLESLFEEASTSNFNGIGCFLFNCMDKDLDELEGEREVINWGFNELFKALETRVIKAQVDTEISDKVSSKSITAHILSSLAGIRNFRQAGVTIEVLTGVNKLVLSPIFH